MRNASWQKVKNNAIRMVEQKKFSYQEYTYEWSEDHLDAGSVAQQIAHPEAIYKTLVAVGNKTGPIVAVIPWRSRIRFEENC